jgi:hypothetical protein
MINIDLIKTSNHFKEKILRTWEVLFDEWDIDNNLYYILEGQLSIEKYTTKERDTTKQLAIINNKDFFWEGSLNNSEEKKVKIIALEETKLLYINGKTEFLEFTKAFPEEAKNILVNIISITNKRILSWNKYITSIYEINKQVSKIQNVNFKEIFCLFEKIKFILELKYLIFLETNNIDKTYLKLKYDSRKPWKMQDLLIKRWESLITKIWIIDEEKTIIKDISIWSEVLWRIILVKDNDFSKNDEIIFLWVINSIFWILKQKELLEEERDKKFSKN